MLFRTLDKNNDWTFGKGKQNLARQNEAIGLNIKTRIKSWLGDCFFAQRSGIDWKNRLGSTNQKSLLRLDLRRIILQSEGVTSINDFDTIIKDRNFTVNFSVETVYSKSFEDSITVGP